MSGQGFTPAPAGQATAAQGGEAKGIPAEKGLELFTKLFGKEFGTPVVAADGTVYAPQAAPVKGADGKYALSYIRIGAVDRASGTIQFTEKVMAKLKEAAAGEDAPQRKLVQVDDQWVFQTFSKDENGKTIVTKIEPATKEELQAEQAKQQQAKAEEAAKAKDADTTSWMQKLQTVSTNVGVFTSAAGFIQALSGGTDPYSGRPGTGWLQGYILASRLNSRADYKLLPSWFTQGPVGNAISALTTAYGLLDTPTDIRNIKEYLSGLPAGSIDARPGTGIKDVVDDLVKKGYERPIAEANASMAQRLQAGKAYAMQGMDMPIGESAKTNALGLVDGKSGLSAINLGRTLEKVVDPKTGLVTEKLVEHGTTRMPTKDIHDAMRSYESMGKDGGARAQQSIDTGINSGLGKLSSIVDPLQSLVTVAGAAISVMSAKRQVEKVGGWGNVLDDYGARQAVMGAISSSSFVAMDAIRRFIPGQAGLAARSAVNLFQNVTGAVQLLDSFGLFGNDGFMNSDGWRAAFLIPPLTPLGGLAFWMKSRKDKKTEEAQKLAAAKQIAQQQIQQQMQMAQQQIQQTGSVSGAKVGEGGSSITVGTSIPVDLKELAARLTMQDVANAGIKVDGAAASSDRGNSNVDRLAAMASRR